MEREHQLHRAFAALHLGLFFAGLGFGVGTIDFNIIVYGLIIFILRLKFWWDDEQYFMDVEKGVYSKDFFFYFGLIIGIASWIVWCFVFLYVKDIEISSLLMTITLLISTFWIIVTLIRKGAYKEQKSWLIFNIIYLVLFAMIYFRSKLIIQENTGYFTSGVLAFLFVTFLFDLSLTRILEGQRSKNKNN